MLLNCCYHISYLLCLELHLLQRTRAARHLSDLLPAVPPLLPWTASHCRIANGAVLFVFFICHHIMQPVRLMQEENADSVLVRTQESCQAMTFNKD